MLVKCISKFSSEERKKAPGAVYRGGGRSEKLVVVLFTDPTKNVGGAKGCLLSKITKVGGAIAPPAPPAPSVPPPLKLLQN